MTGEIDDESFADLIGDAFIIQQKFYIEKIPRMLTI